MVVLEKLPRGIRNNNPGNIRIGSSKWQGMSAKQTDKNFVQFDKPIMGLRALMKLLLGYQRKNSLKTIAGIIQRYAPSNENNTTAYVNAVAQATGFSATQTIDLENECTLWKIAQAIVDHENGKSPLSEPIHWYSPVIYIAAALMALDYCNDEAAAIIAAREKFDP